jgi:lysophospholipase L1-like esterase/dienelactone hydrolase
MTIKHLYTLLLSVLLTTALSAQQVIRLYKGAAPGSENWNWPEKTFNTDMVYNVSTPTLTAFLPDPAIATGTAVIIAGGAFHILAMQHEGFDVAQWLAAKGVAAFVLKYRLVKCETEDPGTEVGAKMADIKKFDADNAPVVALAMQDGLAAVQYVRTHAQTMHIVPNQIGFMGFSAGATITMSVVNNANDANRPNFVVPVYAYETAIIGSEVPAAKTPIFIVAASDDQLGFAPHSVRIYNKWQAASQPAEIHIYERGGHGFGMKKQNIPTDTWISRFMDWLRLQGFAPQQQKNDAETIADLSRELDWWKKDWANLKKYSADNTVLALQSRDAHRVLFLGNSITEFWVYQDPDFFSQNPYIGRGISGQTTPQMLLRFRQDVLNLKPEIVVINAGINDIAENTGPYDPQVTLGNIISMAELAKANHIKVILASVHPAIGFPWRKEVQDVPGKIIRLNEMIKAYAQENKITYLDYHTAMKNAQNGMSPDLAADGVHPTLAGYKIMEELAQKAIVEAKKRK